jgi:DNA-binding MarR family transcriptional regulator
MTKRSGPANGGDVVTADDAPSADEYPGTLRMDTPDAEFDAGLALLELAPRLTRLENSVLGDVDPPLTFRQYRLLERISQGHTTITALGRLATITLPAVSESVEVLVRKGLLSRGPSERDRRESHLAVTDVGARALADARTALDALAATVLTGVNPRRRATLARDARAVNVRVTEELNAVRDRAADQRPTA